ncbi:MAG TPA: F0F1 ATP synthase subunit epsilon [Jiangellales bacterium]|nr:F0F1 ATP synthase subunit epsilon [Jiangellales bacterium]
MAKELKVELVAADHLVWSGPARLVVAKTTEGEIGLMPSHEPVLAVLVPGPVTIRPTEGEAVVAAVHSGFLSMADDTVSVLAEVAEIADEIDVERARASLEASTGDDPASVDARRRAETRLRVAGAR